MLSKSFLQLTAITLLATGIAHADCTPPKDPRNIPNGNKATKEEMLVAHKAVQAYNDQTAEYTSCLQLQLDEDIAKKGDKITDKEKKKLEERKNEKHDAAMDRLQKVADRFNEQVRIFNAKTNNEPAPAK